MTPSNSCGRFLTCKWKPPGTSRGRTTFTPRCVVRHLPTAKTCTFMKERAVSQPLLVVEKLSKSFGEERALDDIDLVINEGEIRCLTGEHGTDKCTVVKSASTL